MKATVHSYTSVQKSLTGCGKTLINRFVQISHKSRKASPVRIGQSSSNWSNDSSPSPRIHWLQDSSRSRSLSPESYKSRLSGFKYSPTHRVCASHPTFLSSLWRQPHVAGTRALRIPAQPSCRAQTHTLLCALCSCLAFVRYTRAFFGGSFWELHERVSSSNFAIRRRDFYNDYCSVHCAGVEGPEIPVSSSII